MYDTLYTYTLKWQIKIPPSPFPKHHFGLNPVTGGKFKIFQVIWKEVFPRLLFPTSSSFFSHLLHSNLIFFNIIPWTNYHFSLLQIRWHPSHFNEFQDGGFKKKSLSCYPKQRSKGRLSVELENERRRCMKVNKKTKKGEICFCYKNTQKKRNFITSIPEMWRKTVIEALFPSM